MALGLLGSSSFTVPVLSFDTATGLHAFDQRVRKAGIVEMVAAELIRKNNITEPYKSRRCVSFGFVWFSYRSCGSRMKWTSNYQKLVSLEKGFSYWDELQVLTSQEHSIAKVD